MEWLINLEYHWKLWWWHKFGWWEFAFAPLLVMVYVGIMAVCARKR